MTHDTPHVPVKATQEAFPVRATIRTIFQAALGFLVLVPVLVEASGVPEHTAGVAGALAVSAAVTRIMAIPGVNLWLAKYVPFLAAEPK